MSFWECTHRSAPAGEWGPGVRSARIRVRSPMRRTIRLSMACRGGSGGGLRSRCSTLIEATAMMRSAKSATNRSSTRRHSHKIRVGSQHHRSSISTPSAAAVRESLANVKELFHDEFAAATTPKQRLGLAKQLLLQADKAPEIVNRWVLFNEVMRLASDAGDLELAFQGIQKCAAQFASTRRPFKDDIEGLCRITHLYEAF